MTRFPFQSLLWAGGRRTCPCSRLARPSGECLGRRYDELQGSALPAGYRPETTACCGTDFPRYLVQSWCPSWLHSRLRLMPGELLELSASSHGTTRPVGATLPAPLLCQEQVAPHPAAEALDVSVPLAIRDPDDRAAPRRQMRSHNSTTRRGPGQRHPNSCLYRQGQDWRHRYRRRRTARQS